MRRLISTGVLLGLVLTGVSSCSLPTLSSLPAPQAVSGPTYTVTADFADALNLPIGAKVKLDGAVVGQVDSITTSDYVAHISMRIMRDQKLSTGTTAQVRFTTPLGEMYVALYPPSGESTGSLANGAHLDQAQTSSAPTIEDAFAALSTLINGGGLTQIGSIVSELSTALNGNSGAIRDLVTRLTALVTDLNDHTSDFDKALAGLKTLTAKLNSKDDVIDQALTVYPEAIRVLSSETGQIDTLVEHVSALATVAKSALDRGTGALLSDVGSARTVLDSLADVRNHLVPVMNGLVAFGNVLTNSAPGDYLNADATVTLNFNSPAILPASGPAATSDQVAARATTPTATTRQA
jgi:phospholipid/cholesterol/gamma-HCH transport system substrate-binding protein